jgi:UDP-4-amino-4,6-dideoxy-N-acetyl-beta-L-altrosamine transaminase
MKKIKHLIPYSKQHITLADGINVFKALYKPYITTGPTVELFERTLSLYCEAKFVTLVSNGTAALHAACYAAGITSGDEVIVSSMTFAASSNAILYCGGTPVFADIEPTTWNIDIEDVKKKITSKTKAIIAVDFTGQVVKLKELKDLCTKNNLVLIEDAAHSIGSRYAGKPIGGIADLTTFSFHPVKHITTGEGGAVLTNNSEYNFRLKTFRTHGIVRDPKLLSKSPYNTYYEQQFLGFNYRLTDIQAALGLSQFNRLKKVINRKREIVKTYNKFFSNIPQITLQQEIKESDSNKHLYIIKLNANLLKCSRDEFFNELMNSNIGCQIHYIPVYLHPYYQGLGYKKGLCPNAEELYNNMITLPLYFGLSNKSIYYVIDVVKKTISKFSNLNH